MTPEYTSERIAKIAQRILAMKPDHPNSHCFLLMNHVTKWEDFCAFSDIVALASYVQDHCDLEAMRKGKIPDGHKLVRRHKAITRRNGAAKR